MSTYAHDDRVMVSPRYMAGAGDRIADVIGPLIHLFGWKHDATTGHVAIDSPDASVHINFDPLHPRGQWLTVAHHEPYWKATFSRQAPLEAVAAVTQALPQLLGDARHADRIPITDMSLDKLAELNGWSAEDGVLTSPDLYCRMEHMPAEEIAWQVEHVYFEGAPLATFTQDTPECLVGQFFSHLTAPMAVERAYADIPLSTLHGKSALITPVRGTAVNPHVHRALAQLDHPNRPGRRR
ncbi:DUF317 domain-containing protein [Streptomyces lydicus]|uniref:DUF317 domain-containing protein n=1 Tax=Streptomyces lydicus TaxID=47763 RepID=UPI001F50CFA8|nr:DUF317 domain-containing protein [Streptomyces lydicus]MCZ1006869.1 DUF317 domain-containing protein [Streptomyces lydicus]